MKKYVSLAITAILVVAIGYILVQKPSPPDKGPASVWQLPTWGMSATASSPNVMVKDGIQYVTLMAKGGYTPAVSLAKGGMPTKLVVKTDGTYDCSSSLVVRSAWYRWTLPATGETAIDLSTPKAGETTQGICGMGMYSFDVKFQ